MLCSYSYGENESVCKDSFTHKILIMYIKRGGPVVSVLALKSEDTRFNPGMRHDF